MIVAGCFGSASLRASFACRSSTMVLRHQIAKRPFSALSDHHDSSSSADPEDGTPDTKVIPSQGISHSLETISLYRCEGLCAVIKPLEWTSQDVVSYVRAILERDARSRGAKPVKLRRRGNKKRMLKVGHGGTLDPLASGVLVLGVGRGTKELQGYLSGAKKYRAGAKLGFETETLDMEGNVTRSDPFDHVTVEAIEQVLPSFEGRIMQVPPIYSAIKKGGKKLYQHARSGKTEDDIEIEAREVKIHDIQFLQTDENGDGLPCFGLEVECGGGTYIRSLVRDIGYKLGSSATMTSLVRTQQGPFNLEDALEKDDWSADNLYAAIERSNVAVGNGDSQGTLFT